MLLNTIGLDDKYALERGRVYVTGVQSLVRLVIDQRRRDDAAALKTGCFISGYRGSPLGAYDKALWQAGRFLKSHDIHFQPGLNEDLAATSVWGTQQVNLFGPSEYDGVVGIWYGKNPGADRCGDAFKHGNFAGTSPLGGVLLLIGDDPGAKSSTVANQGEPEMVAAAIPTLHPATVQEFLDYGILGIALSRYSGCWVAMKCVTDIADSSASIEVGADRVGIVAPADFDLPDGGLHIRHPDPRLDQEERLIRFKLPAAQAFVRANGMDRVVRDATVRRLGIVTTGRTYLDVVTALADLGLDQRDTAALGVTIYKVAMPWPLEPTRIAAYAQGHEELLVVEEKRGLIEDQLARVLFNLDRRPRLLGKTDETGAPLVPSHGELRPEIVKRIVAARLGRLEPPPDLAARLAGHEGSAQSAPAASNPVARVPWYCSGCPHNSSTRVPDGSVALAGIGCHSLAAMMPGRHTVAWTQMGGEGATWIGQAPFSGMKHVFQNMGDGTYFHSGVLGIRAAVAAGVNITFKILYNDAVAMTGGQPHDGSLTPWAITQQAAAEGVGRIVVVSDEPGKYPAATPWAKGVEIHHRRHLDRVQRELREIPGVTILLYDQTCAAEKRRRRKRGAYPDPAKRVFINDLVCEGCGDCGIASNCVSVLPLETEFGRKRTIDQSRCNKDYSCVDGFCPSFVTVYGGHIRRATPRRADAAAAAGLPLPGPRSLDEPFNLLVAGIGGTGIVTVGALIGMAAHVDGKAVTVLDETGLSQMNGAVVSHIRIADARGALGGTRIPDRAADAVLGCDLVVATSGEAMRTVGLGRTHAVVNDHIVPIGAFASMPDMKMGGGATVDMLRGALGPERAEFIDATALAASLFGNSITANLLLVGYAFQRGLVPVSLEALERALELNGVAVEDNKRALALGRRAAVDRAAVEAEASPAAEAEPAERTLDDDVASRVAFLTDYQDAAYAARYAALVDRVRGAEAARGLDGLARAVARYYFKLLAYKDEYEVARLLVSDEFRRKLSAQFDGDFKIRFNLAPPLLARRDRSTGELRTREYGALWTPALRLLARLKRLRGTRFDVFGYSVERRRDRALIDEYERTVDELLTRLDADNHALCIRIAEVPERIRGFGHVRERHLVEATALQTSLLAALRGGTAVADAAE